MSDHKVRLNPGSVGWSDFALKHNAKGSGNSYTTNSEEFILELLDDLNPATPGDGESGYSRKMCISVPPEGFFLPPKMDLVENLPVRAEVVKRQEGEDPYIQTFVTPEDAEKFGYKETPALKVRIVVYSKDALTENNGTRSTDCDWEIVCFLCETDEDEPMEALTMARNFLEKDGGTFTDYSAEAFAAAVYYHSNRGVRVRPAKN